jgi:hypothetical protein
MGGNLFKLGRLPKEDYQKIEAALIPFLDQQFGRFYRIPRYYFSKPDFGDLDIIVSTQGLSGNWEHTKRQIIEKLQLTEVKSVGHVFSTNFMNFQVDYFVVDDRYFETTYNFMCFNDLGNILGKMFRRFNLKYGEEGLQYVYRRDDGHYKTDLPVSQDMAKILAFLELDHATWKRGFHTLEDMFAWAIQSPYFSVKPFLEPSKTTENRIETRTTIQKFVDWLQANRITKTYDYLENRDAYLPTIEAFFPESRLLAQIERENSRSAEVKAMAEKFNGHLVMELTGLQGKELGQFIVSFKSQFPDFEAFLHSHDAATVSQKIIDYWHK